VVDFEEERYIEGVSVHRFPVISHDRKRGTLRSRDVLPRREGIGIRIVRPERICAPSTRQPGS